MSSQNEDKYEFDDYDLNTYLFDSEPEFFNESIIEDSTFYYQIEIINDYENKSKNKLKFF